MTTPQENFSAWLNEHYDVIPGGIDIADFRCKRCGEPVGYVTAHAVERHGDPIEIMPIKNRRSPEAAHVF